MRLGCPSHIGTGTFIAGCQPGRDRAGEGLRCIFRLFWAGLAACDFSGRTRRERVALATGRGKATGFMGPYVPWSYICNLFDTPSWAWEVSTVVFFFFSRKKMPFKGYRGKKYWCMPTVAERTVLWVHIECLQGTPGTVGWTLKMEKAKGPATVGWKTGRNSV